MSKTAPTAPTATDFRAVLAELVAVERELQSISGTSGRKLSARA